MKLSEEFKQELCDFIENSLKSARLSTLKDEDGEDFPLLDFLSIGDTVAEGLEEIRNITEQIYLDLNDFDFKSEIKE